MVRPGAIGATRGAMSAVGPHRPPAWDLLAQAVIDRRTVRAAYHGHERLLCPHQLGWKNGRARVLSYQAAGSTSGGPLNADHHQRWRWMFVDEIEDAAITDDRWQSAPNYRPGGTGIDVIEVAVGT
ncbi:MAG: WYL domain-containing protein [Acidimicrobiales bacterium]